MNERIQELLTPKLKEWGGGVDDNFSEELEKFAELIIEECRSVMVQLYHNTPLELCGPLMTADENIAEHFYGVKE